MTPERMAGLVARWVRFYTRDLPTPIARRRVEEIDADLRDHIAYERGDGTGDRRIALGIASRMVRGLVADAAWRNRSRHGTKSSNPIRRSVVRVALVVAVILSLPLVGMQFTHDVAWGPIDFAAAGALLVGTGLALELAVRKAGTVANRAAVGLALATGLLLVWSNLAVGVIGEPGEPANMMYLG